LVQKKVTNNGAVQYTENYLGNYVYKTIGAGTTVSATDLSYISTGKGRWVKNVGGLYIHEFSLKDHLGNTRVVYSDDNNDGTINTSTEVKQYASYYPFGMLHNRNATVTDDNRKLYNGKEFQSDLNLDWYDYGARMYDAQLGRFFIQDRFAEKYASFTPYQYALNNPVLFIDINGDSVNTSQMTDGELKSYQSGIEDNRDNSKLFDAMYSELESSQNMFTVKFGKTAVRPTGGMINGEIVPDQNGGATITFLEGQEVGYTTLVEELFHAYQIDNKSEYSDGEFNIEFEAKVATTAILMEGGIGYANTAGMTDFQNLIGYGDYGNNQMQITPENVNSASFVSSYMSAANSYGEYNKTNNIGNSHYKAATKVAPASLQKLVNKAYGN
jgi:RHS repeat-associated protein